ncbi:protein kinase domain-containing protein [Natranaerofaba carboxydovora]|uniref:protein kinase domain-containing protein n=1 Tax=Natranaerofaba carboxydovora TaxID=2742683 RepID=UPI001F129609|nr:protein kinase [Natranaerofaba carboxydovora]UMZ74708.1 Protein kinase domain protein [Natranaerofaba carboxydovora]
MSNLFDFVKDIDEGLYNHCVDAEKKAKTSPTDAASNLRRAMEYFLKWFFDYNNLSRKKDDGYEKSNNDMIREAKNRRLLLGWQSDYLHKVKNLGNKYTHTDGPEDTSKKSPLGKAHPDEVIDHLLLFHRVLNSYFIFKKIMKKKIRIYDPDCKKDREDFADKVMIEDYIPIENLDVKKYEEGCEKKYYCKIEEVELETISYYVIRQFRRPLEYTQKDIEFITRDLKAIRRSWDEEMANVVKNHNISTEKDNVLFFTCYELGDEDVNLTEINLPSLTIKERLDMILDVAKGLHELHNADEPIYHRALSPSSIYVRKKKSGARIAKIGNFEYAKLVNVSGATMKTKVINRSVDMFQPGEIKSGGDDIDWSKVDIYSFGMLIIYLFIFSKANAETNVFDALKKFDLSEEFLGIVDSMINKTSSKRPGIEDVLDVIQKEVKEYAKA